MGQGQPYPDLLPQAQLPSQDAPSPLFLPGFLSPFPVPHPVLGAGAEERLNRSSGVRNQPRPTEPGPPGAAGTQSRVRARGPRSPDPSSLRPRSQSPATSHPSIQESRLPSTQLPPPSDSIPGPPPAHPHHSEPQELGLYPPSLRAMLSGERKEGGSPRFGKLHLPVGLWINSPRKQLAKLGRRWPSAASVK